MNKPRTYTPSGARTLADGVWNLYAEMERKFGSERAWEFVLTFYHGTGNVEG